MCRATVATILCANGLSSLLILDLALHSGGDGLKGHGEARAYVIEDDYDGEFHYVGRPLPALKSLDRGNRVLYGGSLSKVLFPGLRLGYLVLPDALLEPALRALQVRTGPPTFEQRVVTAFMAEGHFARHLKRMRNLYAARRQALAQALAATFGERVRVDLQPGGMHLIMRFSTRRNDGELARRAQAAGLGVESLSSRAVRYGDQGLLLSFTNITEGDAPGTCRKLERAIKEDLR